MRDLCAMVRQLGIPTFFVSFSAADRRWPEIIDSIYAQRNMEAPKGLDWNEHCKAIGSNPVTAAVMFDQRVKHLMRELVLSPADPIGKVKDSFMRVEYQKRGWPHLHCLFWVQDAPKLETDSDEDVAKFIDRYISTKLPNSDTDEELHGIVGEVQIHSRSHNKACKKGKKQCRFNFPRPPSARTFVCAPLVPEEGADMAQQEKAAEAILAKVKEEMSKESLPDTTEELLAAVGITQAMYEKAMCALAAKTTIVYKRDPKDCWVNPYNPNLVRAWNANMDIQYVVDPYSCI